MLRVYIKKGHTEAKSNGARTLYAPGHYNLSERMAAELVEDGKAQFVDDDDNPRDGPDRTLDELGEALAEHAPEPSAVIAFDEED